MADIIDFLKNHLLAAFLVFVFGLIVGMVCREAFSSVMGWFCFPDWLSRFMKKRLRRGPLWFYYRDNRNAVVFNDLKASKPYLKRHFAEGEGEIWLFRSDLRAFWDSTVFNDLYVKVIDDCRNITAVKVLLLKGTGDMQHWNKINTSLAQLRRPGHSRGTYIKVDEFDPSEIEIPASFKAYISDETFIFYMRGNCLAGNDVVCIHRRYDDDDIHPKDLRLTLVAAREGRTSGDPLYEFMPIDHVRHFQDIFASTKRSWLTMSDYVISKLNGSIS